MNNTPAFPSSEWDTEYQQWLQKGGMTLRDYFAAKALQGLLTIPAETLLEGKPSNHERLDSYISYISYKMADAMLKARQN